MNKAQYRLYRLYRWGHMKLFGIKPGAFIQDPANTRLGRNVQLSHGTQIYTRNHNLSNPIVLDDPQPVTIDEDSWIGSNAIILPGVHLGQHTIVGAGAIVTHSFIDGWCVITGNPAQKIKEIKKS